MAFEQTSSCGAVVAQQIANLLVLGSIPSVSLRFCFATYNLFPLFYRSTGSLPLDALIHIPSVVVPALGVFFFDFFRSPLG